LLVMVALLEAMGLPWAWHKFCGGLAYEWVGFYTDWDRFVVGISEKRSLWVATWCREKLAAGAVLIQEFSEVLGRFVFATQAVEHVKPLLGPMFAWVAALPKSAFVEIPVTIKLLLHFIQHVFQDDAMRLVTVQAANAPRPRLTFRADARAEGDVVEAGGWQIAGSGDPADSPWFRFRLDRGNAPWAFHGGEPYRSIAAIELYTTLVATMVLGPEGADGLLQLTSVSGQTDNRGNSFAVAKLLSTKYPLNIVLMELALQLHRRGAILDLGWIPREQNVEADELSNGVVRNFTAAHERKVDIAALDFIVLPTLMKVAESFYKDLRKTKDAKRRLEEESALADTIRKPRAKLVTRRRVEDKLRATNPW
jgi:hypothetical protein